MKRLKIVCPYCGVYWHSFNSKEELKDVNRICEYCDEEYEIIPNISKEQA